MRLHETASDAVSPEKAALDVEEDDDDYEPDYYAAEDNEQILNKLDSEPSSQSHGMERPAVLGTLGLPTFRLQPPPPLNPKLAVKAGQGTIHRVFNVMNSLGEPTVKRTKSGINRLAASSYDRDSWITMVTRLATRAPAGLSDSPIKAEDSALVPSTLNLGNSMRESLYAYVLEDFRKRIEVAVSWLSEEWYNDKVHRQVATDNSAAAPLHYDKWALRLLDGFLPYLHAQDKVLTRFLSEIPDISTAILSRVKTLCRDPGMVTLALTSLLYLIMMRPPVRNLALDTMQEIWDEYEEARPAATRHLTKWRPAFLEKKQASGNVNEAGTHAQPTSAVAA